ncbi:MAG: phosphoenolpyruvate--protein phosphotransferase [Pseudomonadota bacterium]
MTDLPTGTGPRVLLRQIREIMALNEGSQDRLDHIVQIIARNMVAEVCSIYLASRPEELELFATVGLKEEAVHETRLQFGEGLVGLVAKSNEPLNLADAPAHPNFAYRPETGEDPFHSFLGVPIHRGKRVLGVLVVQNQTRRLYDEEEIEAVETVSMVLAEIIMAGELFDLNERGTLPFRMDLPVHLKGETYAEGVAMGKVVLHQPRVAVRQLIADDVDKELSRLDTALEALTQAVDKMIGDIDAGPTPTLDVMETYRMFAEDRGWRDRLREAVRTGLSAEAAVERVQGEMRARFAKQRDPYLRERVSDLDDLSNRLLRHLIGAPSGQKLPNAAVVVALNMGAAELFDYDRSKLKGLVLQEGSQLSHIAIVARALGIPLIGRIPDVADLAENGDMILADGETGDVYLRPTEDVVAVFKQRLKALTERKAQYLALRNVPAVTADGERVRLMINAGLPVDLPYLDDTGADGIGLFRTELQYMIHPRLPRLPVQVDFYRQVFNAAGDRPVIFRTLDLGGDKILPYMERDREENPAMGWRAVRIALDRPALMRLQVRALIQAATDRTLNIMFPMVSEPAEVLQARQLVEREIERHERLGQGRPAAVRMGSMLEVPSLAWNLEALLPHIDFLSVGTNDLLQFLFASDRSNPRLNHRYDGLTYPTMALLRDVAQKCRAHNVPLSVCGEMAGSSLEALALIGIGIDTLSMQPSHIGPIKHLVCHINAAALRDTMSRAMEQGAHDPDPGALRRHLARFAVDRGLSMQPIA